MARSAENLKEETPQQQELFHKQSHNLYWSSDLFNAVYLQNDEPLFTKDIPVEDEVPFQQFLEQFKNFCEEFKREKPDAWSERTTINRFIKPILKMLGYKSSDGSSNDPWLEDEPFTYQEQGGNKLYKPDFIIVNNEKNLRYIQDEKGQKKLEEARDSVILPIEAKYWNRIEESRHSKKEDSKRADKKESSDAVKGMDFDDQCLKYMEMLNKQYGILTDGRVWRLYNLSASTPSYKPYFQFNLWYIIKHVNASDFLKSNNDRIEFEEQIKYFYFIFRKKSLFDENGGELFVDELLKYSQKYISRVEEDLKLRFVSAMKIACNGFKRAAEEQNEKFDIDTIRSVSESHIFNILFLRYCESKNILPIKQDPEGYRVLSISNMLDRINGFKPRKEEEGLNELLLKRQFSDIKYNPTSTNLYDRLLTLTKVVQEGNKGEFKGFNIKGFKESIFSKDEWRFVQSHKLTNQEMVRILFEIGYAKSEVRVGQYQQIPYNSFSPRQLGSIYESFLEYRLERAPEDMALIKKQWTKANLNSEKISALDVLKVKKGELFFVPNNKDRKISGSYYTPDSVVQFIVRETLDPIVKNKSSDEILKLKVCDPAMGSAHFLSASLNYLARRYLKALGDEINDDISTSCPVPYTWTGRSHTSGLPDFLLI